MYQVLSCLECNVESLEELGIFSKTNFSVRGCESSRSLDCFTSDAGFTQLQSQHYELGVLKSDTITAFSVGVGFDPRDVEASIHPHN